MKLKKVAYPNSLPHFSFPSMHEAVDETVLPNSFSKTAHLHYKAVHKAVLKKSVY